MVLRVHNAQVAVEIEAVEGTAETLVAADVVLAGSPQFTPNVEANERDHVRSDLSPLTSVPGKRSAQLSFTSWLFGGSAGAANHLADVLKGCGAGETLVALTSATYKPETTGTSSLTAALYMDGVCYKCWGARGEATLLLEAGKPGVWNFNLQAADWAKTDAALLAATLPTTLPPVFQGATITIGGTAIVIQKAELKFGNVLSMRESATAASGNVSALITARRPMLSFNPEDVLVATKDFMQDWKDGDTLAFSAAFGATAGNTFAVTAPVIQYQGITLANRNGVAALEIQGLCVGSSGDDEWSIATT